MITTIRKAVIPAAGLGTRWLPATKCVAKELLPLAGKPLIQHAVEEAVASGIEKILLVSAPGKRDLERYFQRDPVLEERVHARGDGHAWEELRGCKTESNCRLRFRNSRAGWLTLSPAPGALWVTNHSPCCFPTIW